MTKAATAPADKPPEGTAVEVVSTGIVRFDPIAAGLAALRQRLENVVYDVTTSGGMAIARKDRAEIRTLRGKLEAARVEEKREALEYGRKVDGTAKDIREQLEALEANPDQQITAWEQAREAERKAKADAEQRRVAEIRTKIAQITARPLLAVGASTATLRSLVAQAEDSAVDATEYQEFTQEAIGARAHALLALKDALAKSEKADADAAEVAAGREQLRRHEEQAAANRAADEARRAAESAEAKKRLELEDKAAKEKRDAEDRAAKEARDKADADAKAARDAETARLAEEKRLADARQAELDRQDRERIAREHAELEASMQAANKDAELKEFIAALKAFWNAPAGPETTRATLKLCKLYKEALHPKKAAA